MITKPSGLKCEDVLYDPSPAPAKAGLRLCNFPTGSSQLLPKHYDALYGRIVAAAWQRQWGWIDIIGYASRLRYANNEGGNLQLSRQRCESVISYMDAPLKLLGQRFRFNVSDGRGDTASQADAVADDGFRRAVEVRLFADGDYHWNPVPPLRQGYAIAASHQFEFQAVESASVQGWLFEANCMFFAIHDMLNHRIRYFAYKGVGASVPVPKLPAVGASHGWGSPAIPFTTAVPFLDLSEFEGGATLRGDTGLTFGSTSIDGELTLEMSPKGYADRGIKTPVSVTFSFSHGLGVNLQDVSHGTVELLSESFRPANYSR